MLDGRSIGVGDAAGPHEDIDDLSLAEPSRLSRNDRLATLWILHIAGKSRRVRSGPQALKLQLWPFRPAKLSA